MTIGAGQIVAANGYDLSGDVTQFDSEFSKAIVDRTAILDRWRRRTSQGLKDRSWSMRAFWDPTKAERVFREDATAVMARVYGLEAGAYAHSFEGAISPKTTRETPVGELIMWSSEGFVNDQGADLSRLLYYGDDALVSGNNNFYTTHHADIGASSVDRTVKLVAHVHSDRDVQLSFRLYHATSASGPFTEVDSSLRADSSYQRYPRAIVGTEFTGAINQFIGVRVVATAYTLLEMDVANLGTGRVGAMTVARSGASVGGSFSPDFPGNGVLFQQNQVDTWIDSGHAIVTPTDDIRLFWRERGTATFNDALLTHQSSLIGSGEEHYRSTTSTTALHPSAGDEVEIKFQRDGVATDVPFYPAAGAFGATVLSAVE